MKTRMTANPSHVHLKAHALTIVLPTSSVQLLFCKQFVPSFLIYWLLQMTKPSQPYSCALFPYIFLFLYYRQSFETSKYPLSTTENEDQNDCEPNPCAHGGTCTDHGLRNYTCACADGYQGIFCEAGYIYIILNVCHACFRL